MHTDRVLSNIAVQKLFPYFSWALGCCFFFHQTFLSGFRWIQGGPGDSRLVNYILEHTYRWLYQIPPHSSFFNLPIFYPQTNVTSYSDLLIGVAPLYWVWRVLGFQPDTAYQIWMIVLATLNFTAIYLLLKRFFLLGAISSSLASLFFAFNTALYSQIVHQQLAPQFYLVIAIMSLFVMFNGKNRCRKMRCFAIFTFALVWTAQFYTAIYTFVFMVLVCVVAALWTLTIKDWRQQVFELLRTHKVCLITALVLALFILLPGLSHYLSAAEDVGLRSIDEVSVARIYSWFRTSDNNLLYGWLWAGPFRVVGGIQHSWGVGLLTLTLAAIGLFMQRYRVSVQVLVLATLTTAILTTHVTTQLGLWPFVRQVIPGAEALRAMGRIGMIQLIPVAVGLAFFLEQLVTSRRWSLLLLIGGLCVLEQVNLEGNDLSKSALRAQIDSIAGKVDPDCEAFLLVSDHNIKGFPELAYWTTLSTAKPTVNGRSGSFPPSYPNPLKRAQFNPGSVDRDRVIEGLQEWCALHGLNDWLIQVIEVD